MTDWITAVGGPYRREFVALLRSLPFDRIRHLPQPKRDGLPFGREMYVLGRFLRGRANALSPSAFAGAYRRAIAPLDQLLFRAFVLGEPLTRWEWSQLLPAQATREWERAWLLQPDDHDSLVVPFRVIPVDDLLLLTDTQDDRFKNRVHLGQDSRNMREFLDHQPISGRLLDVGTGTGILVLGLAKRASCGVAVDINPRAVELARLNAEINATSDITIEECDAFAARERLGTFDRVVWNAPFVFFPPEKRADNIDGDGGYMGIELTLRFVAELPALLNDDGRAYLMSAAPVLRDGRNLLEEKLRTAARERGLNIALFVVQAFWEPGLREFHESEGITRFESVILAIARGSGRFVRHEAGLLRRSSDAVRSLYHKRVHK